MTSSKNHYPTEMLPDLVLLIFLSDSSGLGRFRRVGDNDALAGRFIEAKSAVFNLQQTLTAAFGMDQFGFTAWIQAHGGHLRAQSAVAFDAANAQWPALALIRQRRFLPLGA